MARQYFFLGTTTPSFTPQFAGSIFVDTTGGLIYFATGTTSSADWDVLPQLLSQLTVDADLDLLGVFKLLNVQGIDYQASAELTIATGVITATQTLHSVDTQSEGPSDDLDTITPDTDLNILYLKSENVSRVVTLKHGIGNLLLPDGNDIVMTFNINYPFIFDGSNWILTFDNAGATALQNVVDDTTPQLGGFLDAQDNRISSLLGLGAKTTTVLDIVTGAITQTQLIHNIGTEAAAATDDLDSIVPATGQTEIIITMNDAAEVPTIKHATGTNTFLLAGDADLVMVMNTFYHFHHDGTNWKLIG